MMVPTGGSVYSRSSFDRLLSQAAPARCANLRLFWHVPRFDPQNDRTIHWPTWESSARGVARDYFVVLIVGRETGGLPQDLHDRYRDRFVGMPLHSPLVRSLNLSTSVGIAVYEVLRQQRTRA